MPDPTSNPARKMATVAWYLVEMAIYAVFVLAYYLAVLHSSRGWLKQLSDLLFQGTGHPARVRAAASDRRRPGDLHVDHRASFRLTGKANRPIRAIISRTEPVETLSPAVAGSASPGAVFTVARRNSRAGVWRISRVCGAATTLHR